MHPDEGGQVVRLVLFVEEGECLARAGSGEVGTVVLAMVDANARFEAHFGRRLGEADGGEAVAKDIVLPADDAGAWPSGNVGTQQPLVIAVPGAEEHPMLAKFHRALVTIGRKVADAENGHRATSSAGFKRPMSRLLREPRQHRLNVDGLDVTGTAPLNAHPVESAHCANSEAWSKSACLPWGRATGL